MSINEGKITGKKVENIVAKGEIAMFSKSSAADMSKCLYRWERVNLLQKLCCPSLSFDQFYLLSTYIVIISGFTLSDMKRKSDCLAPY